jgi:peptide/nickel transport system ATP-binding protein
MSPPVDGVSVERLRVEIAGTNRDIVDEVSFRIAPGEVLGLVGESGSGKTTVALALLGHCRRGARIAAGSICIDGENILAARPAALRAARGRLVAYIPQDPGTALNPALSIGLQLEEMLRAHLPALGAPARAARLAEMMEEVRLPSGPDFRRRYPHQLSGGQQQRVALAMAFSCRPRLIVLDEPTTGLDVTTQAHVLETVRGLCAQHGVAALYVSHDLAVVAALVQRVMVLYAGRAVEWGAAADVFRGPLHPYTQRLLQAVPDPSGRRSLLGIPGHAPTPAARPEGCFFAPRCEWASGECAVFPPITAVQGGHEVRCWHADPPPQAPPAPPPAGEAGDAVLEVRGLDAGYGAVAVLHGIDFALGARECLALVGESGSGKTTLARCIAGLHARYTGAVLLNGEILAPNVRRRSRSARQTVQYIFQNPYASLNPRRTIGETIARPLRVYFGLSGAELHRRVAIALERVALSAAMAEQMPDELSGGERQRVAVARALAAEPQVLVCDEITSALDVSVQAAIVSLLAELRAGIGLSLLFVTHNLALIRTLADRVAVMSRGRIVELGATETVFRAPAAPYTRELLANTPGIGGIGQAAERLAADHPA